MHAAAGRGAVDAADDRLLAVENRPHHALPPALDDAAGLAHHAIRRTLGPGLRHPADTAQVGAGAEVAFAGGTEHDGANERIGGRVVHPPRDLVAHRRRQGVTRVGAVDGDPQHTVVEAARQVVADTFNVCHFHTTKAARATRPLVRTT